MQIDNSQYIPKTTLVCTTEWNSRKAVQTKVKMRQQAPLTTITASCVSAGKYVEMFARARMVVAEGRGGRDVSGCMGAVEWGARLALQAEM